MTSNQITNRIGQSYA